MKKLFNTNQLSFLFLLIFFSASSMAFGQGGLGGEISVSNALEQYRGGIRVDPTWNPIDTGKGYGEGIEADWFTGGEVTCMVQQSDGKLVFFGTFTGFNGRSVDGAVRLKVNNLVDPMDTAFHPIFTGGHPTRAVIHPYGIIVSGNFTHIDGIPRNGLAILFESNGTPRGDFEVGNGPDGPINDIKVLPDLSICLAGNFRHFNGVLAPYLFRIASTGISTGGGTGLLSPSVVLTSGQSINSVTFGPGILTGSSYYYLGGKFSNLGGNAGVNNIARVDNTSGIIDPSFSLPSLAGPLNQVNQVVLSGSDLLVAGNFSVSGVSDILKVSASTAAPDLTFQPNLSGLATSGRVTQIVQAGSSLYASLNAGNKGYIFRLNLSNGLQSAGFSSGISANGEVNSILLDNASSPPALVLGGEFTKIDGEVCNYAGKIIVSTSSPQPLTNSTGANAQVYTSVFRANSSQVYIGGAFSRFNNAQAFGIARLTEEGLHDPTFSSGNGFRNGTVLALALDTTIPGAILAGGTFSAYNGTTANGIIRLLSNGSIDPSFNSGAGANDSVLCISVQADGKIILGGAFTTYDNQPASHIVRLNTDGSVDPSFTSGSGFDASVRSILSDGNRIYAGGSFAGYNGNSRAGLVCLSSAGAFSSAKNSGTGLGSNGSINKIYKLNSNGSVYAAGKFRSFNGLNQHKYLVRLLPNGSPDPAFIADTTLNAEIYDFCEELPFDLVLPLDSLDYQNCRGGLLVSYRVNGDKAGGPGRGIVKLKPKGPKDLQLNSGTFNGPVFTIKRDPLTGKLIVAGNFTQPQTRITRLIEEATSLTIWTGTGGWDWDAPDCGFSALIASNYTNAGFTCKKLFVGTGVAMQPTTQVNVCQDAFSYSSNITGMVHLMKDTIGTDTVKLVEGYFNDLSLDNDSGASIISPTLLYGSLKLSSGALRTNNQLTFKSTAAKTARLAKVENAASLQGQITLERFVGGGAASWHFLGTPIKKQAQSHWADDFLILPAFMYKHNEASNVQNGWVQTSDSMKIGKGFRVFLNQPFFNSQATIRNTGEPFIGNFSFPVAFTPGGYGGGGWNLLANPYPCEIDWHDFNRTNIGSQIHYWTGNQYGSYNSVIQIGVNGAGRYVPSSQAFFVKANSASPSPALSVTEDSKPITAQNPGFYRTAVSVNDEVARIRLISGNEESDETAIRWMPEAQPYFESEFDNHKLENPGMNFFSLSSDGVRSSIQGRNFLQGDSVHLGYSLTEPGSYLLELKLGSALFEGRSWKLRDNESGFIYPVSGNMLFPFFVDEGVLTNPMRFTLLGMHTAVNSAEISQRPEVLIFPNPGKDRFRVHGLAGEFFYRLEDGGGRLMQEGKSSGELNFQGLAPGLYFLALPRQESVKERLKIILLP